MEAPVKPALPLTLLLCAALACSREREEPASPGSPSAQGAALAAELEALALEVQERALAIQAASDPEAVAGGDRPDLPKLRAELSALRERQREIRLTLERMEELALSPQEP
jgi:hypothetical protein